MRIRLQKLCSAMPRLLLRPSGDVVMLPDSPVQKICEFKGNFTSTAIAFMSRLAVSSNAFIKHSK